MDRGQMEEGRADGWGKEGQMDKDRWMDRRADRWIEGQMDGGKEGQMDK